MSIKLPQPCEVIAFSGHRDRLASENDLRGLFRQRQAGRFLAVHGGAKGFDTQVGVMCIRLGIQSKIIRPNYQRFGKDRAPLQRNLAILADADVLVVLWDGRKQGGTYMTMQVALKVGIPVITLPPKEENDDEESA